MNLEDSAIMQAVRAFVAELAARRAFARSPALTLRVRPSGCEAIGQAGETLHQAAGRPVEAVRAVAMKLGGGPGKTAALECSQGLAVMSSFVLPAETADVLQAIVRNKVEGFAPWPLARSAVGQRIRAIADDPAHVMADAVVVSRGLLEDCAGELGGFGIAVRSAAVRLEDETLVPVDFGGSAEQQGAERRFRNVAAGFAAVAACVMASGLYLAWQAYSEGAHYREETAALMARIQGAASGEDGPAIVNAANRLYTERLQRLPAVAVLNDLSRLLPANVWLESLTLDNDKVELKGQGKDIPPLIEILEEASTFRDVNFSSATQANAELNSDAFSIEAMLEQVPAGASP